MSSNKINKLSNKLSEQLQSQISLGSISDITRELIQNSIDANATEIQLKVIYTGESVNLECTDNGVGIEPDELEKIGNRYFTSKLIIEDVNSLNDLQKLDTFGFRGESINSMVGSTSSVTIISKHREFSYAFNVIFTGSVKRSFANRSSCTIENSGTTVLLIDLFGQIPVRKIQMLKIKWEITASSIRNVVFESLINHPEVKINCIKVNQSPNINDHKIFIKCGGNGKLLSLFKEIYGKDTLKDYELISSKYKQYSITCILGTIPLQKKTHQYLFINNRLLSNKDLLNSINKEYIKYDFGYSHLSGNLNDSPSKIHGKPFSNYPVFIIKISSPFEISELIQDPSKVCHYSRHLKIISPMIIKNISLFLANRLNTRPMMNKQQSPTKSPSKKRRKKENDDKCMAYLKSKSRVSRYSDKEIEDKINSLNDNKENDHERRLLNFDKFKELRKHNHCHLRKENINDNDDECLNVMKKENLNQISPFFNGVSILELSGTVLENCKIIGQVDNKFILIKLNNQLLILDQHACDERARVEIMYKDMIESRKINELKKEIEIKLEIEDIERMKLYETTLRRWGIKFNLINDDKNCYITHLPLLIADRIKQDSILLRNGIRHFLDEVDGRLKRSEYHLTEENEYEWILDLSHMPEIYKEIIKSKACRNSIMFGDELSEEECKELIKRLSQCKNPFRCAHGRPSISCLCSV